MQVDPIKATLNESVTETPAMKIEAGSNLVQFARQLRQEDQNTPKDLAERVSYNKPTDQECLEFLVFQYSEELKKDPDNAVFLKCRGETYLFLEKWDKALADFSKILEIDKKNPDAFIGSGIANLYKQDYKRAKIQFELALLFKPEDCRALEYLGLTLYEIAKSKDEYKNAAETLAKAVKNDKVEKITKLTYVRCLENSDQFENASKVFRTLKKDNPQDTALRIDHGLLLLKMNRLWDAKNCFKAAVKLDSKNIEAHLLLGQTYGYLRRYKSSIEACKEGLRIEPTSIDLLFEAANSCRWDGNFYSYEKFLQELKKYYPNSWQISFLEGVGVMSDVREEAIPYFDQVLQQNPDFTRALHLLSRCYIDTNNYAKGLEIINRCIELNPYDYEALTIRGLFNKDMARLDSKYLEKAINDFETCVKYIDLEEDEINLETYLNSHYLNLAELHWLSGNVENSFHILNILIDMCPDDNDVMICYGKLYLYLEEYESAFEHFSAANDLQVEDENVPLKMMIHCKEMLGEYKDALALVQELRKTEDDFDCKTMMQNLKNKMTDKTILKTDSVIKRKKIKQRVVSEKTDPNSLEPPVALTPISPINPEVRKSLEEKEKKIAEDLKRIETKRAEKLRLKRESKVPNTRQAEIERKLSQKRLGRIEKEKQIRPISKTKEESKNLEGTTKNEEAAKGIVLPSIPVPQPIAVQIVVNTFKDLQIERNIDPSVQMAGEIYIKPKEEDFASKPSEKSLKVKKTQKQYEQFIPMSITHKNKLNEILKVLRHLNKLIANPAESIKERENHFVDFRHSLTSIFAILTKDGELQSLCNRFLVTSKSIRLFLTEIKRYVRILNLETLKLFAENLLKSDFETKLQEIHDKGVWLLSNTPISLDHLELVSIHDKLGLRNN